MSSDTSLVNDNHQASRILVVSVRGFRFQVSNCIIYEFEDVLCHLEDAELYAPTDEFEVARKIYRIAKYVTGSNCIASTIAPFPNEIILEKDYDLLVVVCDNPWQMHVLESIKNWRDKCRHKACYIIEMWKTNFDDWRLIHEPFQNFDRIFTSIFHCVKLLTNATGVPCEYIPPGIDALKFCPYPEPPQRSIDISCIGRRSPQVHNALLQYSQQRKLFYYYDTLKNPDLEFQNAQQHRSHLVNILQRSRYIITAPAKFNVTEETGGFQEVSSRFFEGVAAGTVLLGMPPKGEIFLRYFDWEDAVINVDFYHDNIVEVIQELDKQPDKIARISRRNVVNSLLKHDWVYTWRDILAHFDLQPSQAMINREKQLNQLAQSIEASVAAPVYG